MRSSRRGLYALEVHSFDWHLSVEFACPAPFIPLRLQSRKKLGQLSHSVHQFFIRFFSFSGRLRYLGKVGFSVVETTFIPVHRVTLFSSDTLDLSPNLFPPRFTVVSVPLSLLSRLRSTYPFLEKSQLKKHSRTKLSDNSCRHTKFKINFIYETGHDYSVCICSRQWHHTHSGIESSYALLHYSGPFLRRTLYYSLNSF